MRINVDQSAIELVHVRSKLNENREHETIVSVVYRKWHTRRGVKKYRSTGKKCKKKKTRENFRGHALRALHGSKIDRPKKGHWRQASRDGHRLCFCVLWRYTCRSEITRLLQSFGFVSTNFDVIAGLLRKVRITRWNLMESKMFLYDFIAHSVPHQSSFDCKSIGWSAWTQLGR